MQTRTILNRIQKHKGFVYGCERWGPSDGPLSLLIPIRADKRCRPRCSGCDQPGPGYDRLPERRFEFIPMWGIAIFFLYALRRVDCKACGVRVEKVPWAQGKETLCTSYQWFLARWAKQLSWTQVAEAFCTSWESVYKSVQMAVYWGLSHRQIDAVEAIGVDEISWHKNHKYLTLVYDIGVGSKRLLYIARDRTEQSLRGFFEQLGEVASKKLRYVCSDMWAPYLKVIAEKAGQAVNILDRFHIMKKFNEAIDQVRRDEARRMKQEGSEPLLVHARWCLLKRTENLTERQASKLKELLCYNLRSVRAYLLREEFQRFWQYVRPSLAARFLDQWCKVAMRSRLEPIKKVVGMLRNHRALILNWFAAQGTMSSGTVEGLNHKAKVVFRNAYGYRHYNTAEIALYHTLGALPEPEFTHRFR
jgi:transposase